MPRSIVSADTDKKTVQLTTVARIRGAVGRVLIVAASIAWGAPTAHAVDASVWPELGRVQTLEARFTQVQQRAILKTPLTSTGVVSFRRPDTLSWVVEAPARSSFTLEHGIATMAYPDLGMKDRIDLAAVPDANRLATSLLVWLQADAVAVERDFTVTYAPTGATLVPRDPRLAGLIASIELTIAPSPARVERVVLAEPDGDRVEIRFSGVKLDGVTVP